MGIENISSGIHQMLSGKYLDEDSFEKMIQRACICLSNFEHYGEDQVSDIVTALNVSLNSQFDYLVARNKSLNHLIRTLENYYLPNNRLIDVLQILEKVAKKERLRWELSKFTEDIIQILGKKMLP